MRSCTSGPGDLEATREGSRRDRDRRMHASAVPRRWMSCDLPCDRGDERCKHACRATMAESSPLKRDGPDRVREVPPRIVVERRNLTNEKDFEAIINFRI